MVGKRILIIAGSDSSGGAGLEADQKVIAAHGCYAMTATTALTAQNTLGVFDIHPIPPAFLKRQLDACFDDIGVDVVKTGMLASPAVVDLVATTLEDRGITNVIVDPVMVSTTGASLMQSGATGSFLRLAKLALLITPNIPELKFLLGRPNVEIENVSDFENIALVAHKELASQWLLVKGGHLPFRKDFSIAATPQEREIIVNVLVGPGDKIFRLQTDYQDSQNTHGTGCSLASAIASNLANGLDMYSAVKSGCQYVEAAIRYAPGYGRGHGPLNHFHATFSLPFARGYFFDYLLGRTDVTDLWGKYINHAFVRALGNGSLPIESFKGYLIQDYLYLVQFARANALAAYKAKSMKDITHSAAVVQQLDKEMKLHVDFCAKFGLARQDIDKAEEKTACVAYSRYVLDIGQSEDWLGLQIALAPCIVGYNHAAAVIDSDNYATKRDGNPYWPWVKSYISEEYKASVRLTMDRIEQHVISISPSRVEELVDIFKQSTKMEIEFWSMYSSI